jgi:arsenate reductase
MRVVGIDLSGRTPREITFEETQESDYVITMGCSADDVCPAGWAGESRDWNLNDPDEKLAADTVGYNFVSDSATTGWGNCSRDYSR